jgi:oligogalacturonide lyase
MKARSRRWFLVSIPAAAGFSRILAADIGGKGRSIPAATTRYADPSTEFPVVRLTDPTHSSILPSSYQHPISKRNFLLYASDMSGRYEAYRMDLKNGQSKQLTDSENLNPATLALLADDHSFCYIDGDRVMESSMSMLRAREIYRIAAGFEAGGLSVAEDGQYVAVVEKKAGKSRLQLVHMLKGGAAKLAECDDEIHDPIPRPKRASVLYRRAQTGAWLANYDGQHDYRLRLAEGETGVAQWSPDGRSVLYLNYPAERGKLHALREFTPDTNEDKLLAPTSQFVGFGSNADASVFVGASGSKASPHVLLLVRTVKRELTLAEHRASDPKIVRPVFSPNSQRIYFSSDQHGKPAIYTMSVEKLVEETDAQG